MPNNLEGFGKIAIGLRYTKACSMFMDSWTALVRDGLRPGDVVMPVVADLPHHFAAEILLWQFMKTDCDSVLLVDDDHGFEVSLLQRLRDNVVNHSFDVVGGLYACRRPAYKPILMTWNKTTGEYGMRAPATPRTTEAVDLLGMGFTLVRRRVIERLREDFPGEMLFYWPSDGDGEDATFCKLVSNAGFKIGMDTTAVLDHQISALVRCNPTKSEVSLETEVNVPFQQYMENMKRERKQALENRIARAQKKQGE